MAAGIDRLPSVFTYRDALAAGLTKHRIYDLRRIGVIEPVARGLYRRTDVDQQADQDLIEIVRRAPRATLCLTTALVRHGLTDANPSTIDVALPARSYLPRLSAPVTWHLFNQATFDIGRTTLAVDEDADIGIYNAERCIVDAFRLRHREGDELGYIALRRWLRRRGSSPASLYHMTQHFPNTTRVITSALEIIQYE